MSGNGGSAASNAATPSGSHAPNPDLLSVTQSARPSPNDVEAFIKWSYDITYCKVPPDYVHYILYSATAGRFGVNAFLGTQPLEPRCRYHNCAFHGRGTLSYGENCPRGQAGSASKGDKFGFGLVYMSPDMSRVNDYGLEAIQYDNEEKIGYVVLTINVIIPKKCVYITTREDLIRNGMSDRNFWWENMGYDMIVVSDGIGGHLTEKNSYDAALKNLSYMHITRCVPHLDKQVNADNGIDYCLGNDGIIVIDAVKALKIGIYATKEIAQVARQNSTTAWDVYDRAQLVVSGVLWSTCMCWKLCVSAGACLLRVCVCVCAICVYVYKKNILQQIKPIYSRVLQCRIARES